METTRGKAERKVGRAELDELMGEVFGGAIHAPRVASLRTGVDGVLHAASLGVRAIGQGLAGAHGLAPRHAITQVDRLLSNPKRLREDVARGWVRCVVAARQARFVNFDGTEFEDSDQSMIVLGTQTEHGRSTPLVWKTVTHSELKAQRHAHEDELLGLFAEVRPQGVRVTVVADRGFSDLQRYRFLKALGFESSRRCRGVVSVESADGARRTAQDGLGAGGQRRVLRGTRVTAEGQPVPIVVGVQQTTDAGAVAAREPSERSHRHGPHAPLQQTLHGGRDVQRREEPPPGAGAEANRQGAQRPQRRPLPLGSAGSHAADTARQGRRGARHGPMAWCHSAAAILPLPPGTDALRADPDDGTAATQDSAPAIRPVASRTCPSLPSPWLSLENLRGCLRVHTTFVQKLSLTYYTHNLRRQARRISYL